MEVHHHSNSHSHSGKNWKQYFWEFLMLFLAVFCGFLAENQREHIVEHKRELQFVQSFANDLRLDIYELDSLIRKREERKKQIDSLSFILCSPDPDHYRTQAYFYARYLPRPYVFIPNDATIQQLKNSGNLRLIRKQEVADVILSYDRQFRFFETIRIREESLVLRIFNYLNDFFDPAVFDQMNVYDIEFKKPAGNPVLLTKDKKRIHDFLSEIHYLKTVNIGQIGWFQKQKQKAEFTLAFLQKEYHLK
jgi:hypothetical protein